MGKIQQVLAANGVSTVDPPSLDGNHSTAWCSSTYIVACFYLHLSFCIFVLFFLSISCPDASSMLFYSTFNFCADVRQGLPKPSEGDGVLDVAAIIHGEKNRGKAANTRAAKRVAGNK